MSIVCVFLELAEDNLIIPRSSMVWCLEFVMVPFVEEVLVGGPIIAFGDVEGDKLSEKTENESIERYLLWSAVLIFCFCFCFCF